MTSSDDRHQRRFHGEVRLLKIHSELLQREGILAWSEDAFEISAVLLPLSKSSMIQQPLFLQMSTRDHNGWPWCAPPQIKCHSRTLHSYVVQWAGHLAHQWSPVITIETILISLQAALSDSKDFGEVWDEDFWWEEDFCKTNGILKEKEFFPKIWSKLTDTILADKACHSSVYLRHLHNLMRFSDWCSFLSSARQENETLVFMTELRKRASHLHADWWSSTEDWRRITEELLNCGRQTAFHFFREWRYRSQHRKDLGVLRRVSRDIILEILGFIGEVSTEDTSPLEPWGAEFDSSKVSTGDAAKLESLGTANDSWTWVSSEASHADPTKLPADGRLIDLGRGETAVAGFSRFHLEGSSSEVLGVLHAADVLLLQKEFRMHMDRAPGGRRADIPAVDDQLFWEGDERPPMSNFDAWTQLSVPEPRREDLEFMVLLEKTSARERLEALRERLPVRQRTSRSISRGKSRSGSSKSRSRSTSSSRSGSSKSSSSSSGSSGSSKSSSGSSSRSGSSNSIRSCSRASPQQDAFAFQRLVDYRPPWEAFRLNGVYDDFYAVMWKDQSVTWEPGQLLHSHPQECAQALERWLKIYEWREGLGEEIDPAPTWVPTTATVEGVDEIPALITPTRAKAALASLWGSLVEANIPIVAWGYASSGECKRMKMTCHQSRANSEVFYCWSGEGSLLLKDLRNAMISSTYKPR